MKLCRRQPGTLTSCDEQESYLIVHVCSRAVLNASVLPNMEYCDPVWMSSAKSHLSLLDCIVRSAERLREGKLCCLGHNEKGSALCLLCDIYHRAGHALHGYMYNFLAACNITASAALCELVLVIPRYRTDQFSRSFLPVDVRLYNLLPSVVFSGGTLSIFHHCYELMPTEGFT